jgi:hypothetical protein
LRFSRLLQVAGAIAGPRLISWLINGAMDTFYNAIVSVSNYYEQLVPGNDTNIFGSNDHITQMLRS